MAQQISADLRRHTLDAMEAMTGSAPHGDLAEHQNQLLTKLVQLRAANRVMWQNSKVAKAKTSEAKSEIDRLNLSLQGLYYEQRHIRNEIKACKDTPTIYQDVSLISEADFFVINPEAKSLNGRDLMLGRLAQEKGERLHLEGVKKELIAKKAALIAENKRRKGDLESLEAQLQSFVAASEKIQSIFEKY